MALPVKKIFIDTKYMTTDSQSTSNFKIQLNRSIEFPDDTSMFINNICIPHSWWTVEENFNDTMYLKATANGATYSGVWYKIIKLTPGIYNPSSLAAEIQTKMVAATNETTRTNIFNCTWNSANNLITISVNYLDTKFQILTSSDLKTKLNGSWLGPDFNINYLYDCNELISNLTSNTYDYNNPYKGVVNLQPIRNIYIHSGNLSVFQTMGPTPDACTCIKKVPVNADVGQYIFYDEFLMTDVLDCSKQSISVLEFTLRDSKGNIINLHNNNSSFSIGFVKQDMEF